MYKLVKKGLPFKEFAVICFDGRCRNPSVQEGAEGEESSSRRQVKRGCICFLVSTRCFCSFVPKHLGLPKSTWRNSRKGGKKSQYMLVSIGCSPGTLRLPNALLRPTCTPNCWDHTSLYTNTKRRWALRATCVLFLFMNRWIECVKPWKPCKTHLHWSTKHHQTLAWLFTKKASTTQKGNKFNIIWAPLSMSQCLPIHWFKHQLSSETQRGSWDAWCACVCVCVLIYPMNSYDISWKMLRIIKNL